VTSSPPAGDLKRSSVANGVDGKEKNFPGWREIFVSWVEKEMKIVKREYGARVVEVALNVRVK